MEGSWNAGNENEEELEKFTREKNSAIDFSYFGNAEFQLPEQRRRIRLKNTRYLSPINRAGSNRWNSTRCKQVAYALLHQHAKVQHAINYSPAWIDRDETVTVFNSRLTFSAGERSSVAPLRTREKSACKIVNEPARAVGSFQNELTYRSSIPTTLKKKKKTNETVLFSITKSSDRSLRNNFCEFFTFQ